MALHFQKQLLTIVAFVMAIMVLSKFFYLLNDLRLLRVR